MRRNGFTFIELLVVMVVASLLIGLTIWGFSKSLDAGRLNQDISRFSKFYGELKVQLQEDTVLTRYRLIFYPGSDSLVVINPLDLTKIASFHMQYSFFKQANPTQVFLYKDGTLSKEVDLQVMYGSQKAELNLTLSGILRKKVEQTSGGG